MSVCTHDDGRALIRHLPAGQDSLISINGKTKPYSNLTESSYNLARILQKELAATWQMPFQETNTKDEELLPTDSRSLGGD